MFDTVPFQCVVLFIQSWLQWRVQNISSHKGVNLDPGIIVQGVCGLIDSKTDNVFDKV